MGDAKKDFFITLFLGIFGVHKFRKKKFFIGLIYLFTFGGVFVLWLVDVFISFIKLLKSLSISKPIANISNLRLVKSFDTVIVGTFAKCALDPESKREDLITYVKPSWELYLEPFTYKGDPAYYVCHPNGADLGCVRQGLSKILYDEYSDCTFKVTALERGFDNNNDVLTQNIRIDIYKK